MMASVVAMPHGIQLPSLFTVIMSLIILVKCKFPESFLDSLDYKIMIAALVIFASPLINMAIHGSFDLSELDNPSRFLLAIPVFLCIRLFAIRLHELRTGVFFGCVFAGCLALYQAEILGMGRVEGFLNNPISFGNLAVLVGSIALCFFVFETQRWMQFGWVFTVLFAAYASLMSGTRGGWVLFGAIPIFLWIHWRYLHRRFLQILIPVTVFAITLHGQWNQIKSRFQPFFSGIECWFFESGRICDGSVSVRFETFYAGLIAFLDRPVAGYGLNTSEIIIRELKEKKLIEDIGDFGHFHNDFVEVLATQGLIGFLLFCIAMILLIRVIFKIKERDRQESQFERSCQVSALVAMCVLSLSQSMLSHASTNTAYAMLLIILSATTINSVRGR